MYSLIPVLSVFARILVAFSPSFFVPLAWAVALDAQEHALMWTGCFGLTLASGLALMAATRNQHRELQPRDGFLLVNLVWLVLPAFAAIPLMYTVPDITWIKAYFEAMSGLTATGATALSGLDALPASVNVWRCFLHYLGGLGIMLLVVAVLPMMGLGGFQVYKAEMPGPMKDAKFTPRIAETARGLWGVYFAFSVACMLAYRWAGMSWVDAFTHMCSTMGLGGFSAYDASFGHFNSLRIEMVATLFMALAGINFMRYFIVLRNRSVRPLLHDREIRSYLMVLLTGLLVFHGIYPNVPEALRASAFHVVSVATTTGFATTDYALWPAFAPVMLMFLGTFASCAGSTGGGMKMIRIILLIKQARRELVRIVHPRVVNPVTLAGEVVPISVMTATFGFMLIYGAVTIGLSMILLLSGLDIVTAFSAVVATVNNIGPGLGQVGPSSNFGVLNDFQLWVLSFSMLMGRLELLTFLVLFTGQFWRK